MKTARTMWEYHNKDEASILKKKFDAIFDQYGAQLEQAQQVTSGEELIIMNSKQYGQQDDLLHVPVALAIQ